MAPLSCVCSKGGVLCSCLSLSPVFIVPACHHPLRSLFLLVIVPCVHCSLPFIVPHCCWLFPTLVVPQSWSFPAVRRSPLLLVVPCVGCSPHGLFHIIGHSHSPSWVIPIPRRWSSPFPIVGRSLHLSFPPGRRLSLMGLVPAVRHSLFFIVPCCWSSSAPPYLPMSRGLQAGWWCYVVQ